MAVIGTVGFTTEQRARYESMRADYLAGRKSRAEAYALIDSMKPWNYRDMSLNTQSINQTIDSWGAGGDGRFYQDWGLSPEYGMNLRAGSIDGGEGGDDNLQRVPKKTARGIWDAYKAGGYGSLDAAVKDLGDLGYDATTAGALLRGSVPPQAGDATTVAQGLKGQLGQTTEEQAEARRQADRLALIQDPDRAFEQLFSTAGLQPGSQLNRSLFNFLGAPAKAGFRLSPFLRSIPIGDLGSFQLSDFTSGGLPSQGDIVGAFRAASADPAGMTGSQQIRAKALQEDPSQEMQEMMFQTAFQPWLARSGTGFRNELSRFLEQQFNRLRQESPGLGFLQELGQNRLPQFRGFGGF